MIKRKKREKKNNMDDDVDDKSVSMSFQKPIR